MREKLSRKRSQWFIRELTCHSWGRKRKKKPAIVCNLKSNPPNKNGFRGHNKPYIQTHPSLSRFAVPIYITNLFSREIIFCCFPGNGISRSAILLPEGEISRGFGLQVLSLYLSLSLSLSSIYDHLRFLIWFLLDLSLYFVKCFLSFLKLYNRDGVDLIGLDDAAGRLGDPYSPPNFVFDWIFQYAYFQ